MYSRVQDIDLRLLQIFTIIAKCNGFSVAQAQLNMNQSAISTSMATLETRLGYRLCERGKSGFYLTEEGKRILKATEEMFLELDVFVAKIRGLSGRLFGQLAIGLLDNTLTLKDAHITAAITRFYKRKQDVCVSLYIKSPTELEQSVLDGEIHAAIAYTGHRIPNLRYIKLFNEKVCLYCGNKHPLFNKTKVSVDDIHNSKWVRRGYLMPSDLVPIIPKADQMTAVAHQMEGIALMILAGTHLGYLPEHYARLWVDKKKMRCLNPDNLSYDANHCLFYNRKHPHNEALEAFISDVLAEHNIKGG